MSRSGHTCTPRYGGPEAPPRMEPSIYLRRSTQARAVLQAPSCSSPKQQAAHGQARRPPGHQRHRRTLDLIVRRAA